MGDYENPHCDEGHEMVWDSNVLEWYCHICETNADH